MKPANKASKIWLLYFIIFVSIISCKDGKENTNPENLWMHNVTPELVSQLKIKSRIKTEIKTDFSTPTIIWSNGKELSSNKIRSIEYYNPKGFLILEVTPSYKMVPNDKSRYSKLSEWDKIFIPKEIESNEPTGYSDSTFYFYDESNRLIKTEFHKTTRVGVNFIEFTEKNIYDNNDNIVQKCFYSENRSTFCRYTNFQYDNKGRIISEVDSFSVDIQRPDRPNKSTVRNYKYNAQSLVSSINETNFIYNENKLLIEKNIISGNVKTDIEYYSYDANGNCVKIEHIRSTLSTFDPKTNVTTVQKFDTSLSLRQYDKNNLILETSYKHSAKNKDYNLYKYEYTY